MKSGIFGVWERIKAECLDYPILPFLVLVFVAACLFVPNFFTYYNLKVYCLQCSDILILACGVTFVVLNGGIDFSATATLTLSSVVGAYIMAMSPLSGNPYLSIPVAIVVMAALGLAVGTVNGISVTVFKMPSFIATLVTQLAATGCAIIFVGMVTIRPSISGLPDEFFFLGGSGRYFLVPIVISLVVWAFSHWLLRYTYFGRCLYAVGVNPKTAFISGIPVKRVIFKTLVLSGVYAGLASVIATARNQVGVTSLGDKMFISVIACVIVGGTSVAGGFGGVKQTLFGVLFITLLNNTMNLLGVEWYIIMIEQGILILFAAILGYVIEKNKKRVAMKGAHAREARPAAGGGGSA